MSTRALAIRDAILIKLRAASVGGVPSERIYSDLRQALHASLRPAIAVDMGDEDPPVREYSKRRRAQAITISIIEDAADPYTALDPIRIAVHARIMSQPTTYAVTSSTWSGGYLTCNVASAAGLMAGSSVALTGMQAALNATWPVYDIPTGATSFRIAMADPTLTDGVGTATDVTLSALIDSIEEGGTSRERADLDVPIGSLVTTYLVRYTTSLEALT
jgi:hypothetical protein